jgi:hypothetical protein
LSKYENDVWWYSNDPIFFELLLYPTSPFQSQLKKLGELR